MYFYFIEEANAADIISEQMKNNPFARISDGNTFSSLSNSRVILRQSRLSFSSSMAPISMTTAAKETSFSTTNHNSSSSSINKSSQIRKNLSILTFCFPFHKTSVFFLKQYFTQISLTVSKPAICGVCSTISPTTQQVRKYGISSCEACWRFFYKSTKKLAVTGENSLLNGAKCKSGDG